MKITEEHPDFTKQQFCEATRYPEGSPRAEEVAQLFNRVCELKRDWYERVECDCSKIEERALVIWDSLWRVLYQIEGELELAENSSKLLEEYRVVSALKGEVGFFFFISPSREESKEKR